MTRASGSWGRSLAARLRRLRRAAGVLLTGRGRATDDRAALPSGLEDRAAATSRRRLVYVPKIAPETFLYFFFRGTAGRAYSFRDYSCPDGVRVSYASEYPYTADEILEMAELDFDAPLHEADDVAFWRAQILALNERHLTPPGGSSQPAPLHAAAPAPRDAAPRRALPSSGWDAPPMPSLEHAASGRVDAERLRNLDRIRSSARGQDWLLWNVLQLLSLLDARDWWPELLEIAASDRPQPLLNPKDPPRVDAWVAAPAPPAYDRRLRERLASSPDPERVARARDPRPLEAPCEVDLALTARTQIGFLAARLGGDVRSTTTYDPQRNEIARTIDCLLEQAGARTPFFWMLAADRGPERLYSRLIQRYREDPRELARDLPHRRPESLIPVAESLAIVAWRDLLDLVRQRYEILWKELSTRIGNAER